MSNKELPWIIIASTIIVALSSLPYVAGYQAQTKDLVFSGAAYDRPDYAVHLTTMHLGARGASQYQFRFTHEPHEGRLVKLGYIVLGRLTGFLSVSPEIGYQLFRALFGFVACFAIYLLMAQIFDEITLRRMGFLLATMGAGLGWLQLIMGWHPDPNLFPIDFWLIDAFVFFGIFVFPHFGLMIALLAGSLAVYLSFLESKKPWKLFVVLAASLAVIFIQPYAIAIADLALGGALVGHWLKKQTFSWFEFWTLLAVGIAQLPLLLYNLVVFNSPPWNIFAGQIHGPSPSLPYFLLGFAIFWPLAVLAVKKMFSFPSASLMAATTWGLGALVLAYIPLVIQRRFTMALSIPLGVLAAEGFGIIVNHFKNSQSFVWIFKRKNFLSLLIASFAALSPLYLLFGTSLLVQSHPPTLFDPAQLVNATNWLAEKVSPEDCVMGAEQTGLLIAARNGQKVFLGHESETFFYSDKIRFLEDFYQSDGAGEKLRSFNCDWIIYGPYEKELGDAFDSTSIAWLQKVYEVDGVEIFKMVE